MSDFPYFNEYLNINRLLLQLKSKFTSIRGQNYFVFFFSLEMEKHADQGHDILL